MRAAEMKKRPAFPLMRQTDVQSIYHMQMPRWLFSDQELRVCEKRVTAAFQKLAELDLIWEKRCGRGDANQIYLAHVQPQDDPAYTSAPFVLEGHFDDSRTADTAGLDRRDLRLQTRQICGQVIKKRKRKKEVIFTSVRL